METWWLGPAIALTGTVLAFIYFRANRKATSKVINWVETANQALMSGRQGWRDLVVQYEGQPVIHPRVMTLRFENRGAVELRPADYDTDALGVRLVSDDARLVSSYVLLVKADGSRSVLDSPLADNRTVTVPPTLLNPGDAIEVRLLVDGIASVLPTGRLAGFKLESGTGSERRPFRREFPIAGSQLVFVTTLGAIALGFALLTIADTRSTTVPAIEDMTYSLARDVLRDANLSQIETVALPSEEEASRRPSAAPIDDWIVARVEPTSGTEVGVTTRVTVYLQAP